MKKFKKLIPALCMLLVSAVMLGSTTFAWFSMNSTVTATGMSIQANVPTNLYILEKKTDLGTATDNTKNTNGWTNTVALTSALTDLPAVGYSTTATVSNGKVDFKKLTDQGLEKVLIDGSVGDKRAIDELTALNSQYVENATANADYIAKEVDLILNSGKADQTAKISAKVSLTLNSADNGKEIRKAVHVMFVVGTTKYDLDMGSATADEAGTLYTISQDNIIAALATTAPTTVSIYVWYDGPDSDCKNATMDQTEAFTFSIEFTATLNNA